MIKLSKTKLLDIKLFQEKFGRKRETDILPFSVKRKRLYILPSGYGFLFLGILFAMLLGSINYNNNLGFLLVFLLGSITLISIIHTYRNMLGIKILSASAPPVFAGKTGWFEFLVRAEVSDRRSIGFMIEKQDLVVENIDAKTDQTVWVKFFPRTRGIFIPDRMTVRSHYPLGLFTAWTVITPDVSCVVYPAPLAGPFGFSGSHDGKAGSGESVQRGVDDFAGLKPYQPGDSMSRISWKSISRGLGVFTKEFTGASGRMVMLDYDAVNSEETEHKLSRLCDMVIKAHNMNMEYGLLLPGRTIAPEKGERHKHKCLKALALFGLEEVEGESRKLKGLFVSPLYHIP